MKVLAAIWIALALTAIPALADDLEDGAKYLQSKDYASAISSFHKAAAQGHAQAQFNLGVMYDQGRGVAQDYKQATFWYDKSGRAGKSSGAESIGCYV